MKKLMILGVVALLGLSFTACGDHDCPTGAPEVAIAPNTLSGVITDMSGQPVGGATVTVGDQTVTTTSEGIYHFDHVGTGTLDITVSAPGMVTATGSVTITGEGTQNVVWNATMAKINTAEVNVTVNGGGTGEVESEALRGNDPGKVDITVDVPANTVPANTNIYITPIYTEETAAVSRAEEEEMLIGATLSCSDPNVTLSQDIDLSFALDGSIVDKVETKKYVNGQWVSAPHAVVNGNVVISTRDFTSYGLFIKINGQVSRRTMSINFEQSVWDNLNGTRPMEVGSAVYTYKIGTEITSKASNKLQGLLIEWLSRNYGSLTRTMPGAYPLNLVLPVGTKLVMTGAQEYDNITVSGGGASVKAITYGTVNIQAATYTSDHSGGTSGPIQ